MQCHGPAHVYSRCWAAPSPQPRRPRRTRTHTNTTTPYTQQVGIIPTDSLPAVVCDLENRDAVLKLYACMQLSPKKKLSVLCR